MTINVGLVTNEALILGCDSVASTTRYLLDPTKVIPRDAEGNWIQDEEGNWNVKFNFRNLDSVVTNAWGGVQKMFILCGGQRDSHTTVAAVTSGLATMLNRTMNNFAGEFHRAMIKKNPPCETVEDVVDHFINFMGQKYDEHFGGAAGPEELKEDIEFLVGGYGRNDALPTLFRVKLKDKSKDQIYSPTAEYKTGLAWAGLSMSVQRILRGYDLMLQFQLNEEFDRLYQVMSQEALRIVTEVLEALGAQMPAGVNSDLPAKPDLEPIYKRHRLNIDYENMPLQDAIDFVAYLVNLESGKHKFVRGVPTVGGRTHISVITRNEGFRVINPPPLTHKSTGFARDL